MDDGMTKTDHQSTQLNAHATEFIPAQHKAFLNEYPSLSSKQTPLPRPRRKLDSPLNFQAVASKTPSHPLTAPQPTPALPQGFVALSKPKREPEADTKPPDKPVIEKPVAPIPKPTKRKHTTKPLTQWCAPPRPAPSSPTLEPPTIVETAVETNAQGRSPGYFFHLAAQSKVQGQSSASYHEAGQWLPEKVARPPPTPALPLDVDAPPSSVESIRTEWQTLLQQHIGQLDRVDLDAIKAFLRLHRSLLLWDERDDERRNAWHLAATFGHDEVLELLATLGEGVDARDRKKQTPLHLAAAHGRVSSVRLLLSLGASASVVDKNGNTPFHLACRHGHLACVKILLHKTKLDVRNKQRNTPLGLAVSAAVSSPPPNDALAVVHLLLASGASALSVNHNGETPLYMALESLTTTTVFELLLVYGYPLSSKTIRSVFLRTVALGHLAALELFLPILPPQEWTAVDPDTGDTALHVCIRHGHAEKCIPLLCSKQSKLLAMENAQLLTPLFLAIHLDDAVALKTLLTYGGYPNERNRRNQSALFAALVKSKSACVRVLVEFGCALDADCIAYVQQTTRVDAGSPPTKRRRWTQPDLLLESVDGVQLSMHKCVLVARSAVFRAQLCGLWSSHTTSPIAIDCTAATFNRLADYLYTGTLQLAAAAVVALDDLLELLVAANAWLLFDLQHLCIAALRDQLDPFELADVVGQLGIADVPTTRLAQRATKQWRQDMLDLMTEGWFADVTIISTDNVTRTCHRAVLASVSAVMETQVESTDRVSFPYTSTVLHLLLDYIYADVIDLEKMPCDLIQDTIVASAAYHIWPCVFACESFVVTNIASLADADLLAFAQAHATVVPRLLAACRLRLLEMVAHDPAILLACLA